MLSVNKASGVASAIHSSHFIWILCRCVFELGGFIFVDVSVSIGELHLCHSIL